MHDIRIAIGSDPEELARIGEALGAAGISVEGGAAFAEEGQGVVHFLVEDGAAAVAALRDAGIGRVAQRNVLTLRLDQERPGQLGAICRRLATSTVGVEVLYSDHQHRLVLCVTDEERGRAVRDLWMEERAGSRAAGEELQQC